MTLPKVVVDQQRGNYAEHFAEAWLSRQCLVRSVASGTDIGIDLYCESIHREDPFHHFWVQVKAISQSNIHDTPEGLEAFCDFQTRHLRYWSRQPVPVYSFLVPVESWPAPEPDRIFGVNISYELLKDGIPSGDQHRYSTTDCIERESLKRDLTQFVSAVVPVHTAALLAQHGVIPAIEWPEARLESHLPAGLALRHIEQIDDATRLTLEICLTELLQLEDPTGADLQRRSRYSRMLLEYKDNLTAMGASSLAQSLCLDNQFELAFEIFNLTEELVLAAPVPEAKMKSRLAELAKQRALCQSRQSLQGG